MCDIQRQRWLDIGESCVIDPGHNAGVIRGDIAGLPDQMRQLFREEHRVLPRAAADFQHASYRCEFAA